MAAMTNLAEIRKRKTPGSAARPEEPSKKFLPVQLMIALDRVPELIEGSRFLHALERFFPYNR